MSTQATDHKPKTVEVGQRWTHKGSERTVAEFSDDNPLKMCAVFHETEDGTNQRASAIILTMLTHPEWVYVGEADRLQPYRTEALADAHGAGVRLVRDLMRGDPATFKAGYTLPNAVIAAGEVLDLTYDQQQAIQTQLAEE